MIENCLTKKGKKKFGGKQRFSAGAAVPLPFLHSSILFSTKAIAVPNFKAVTLLWTEIMHVLLLVSKSGTSASPLSSTSCQTARTGFFQTLSFKDIKKFNISEARYPFRNTFSSLKSIISLTCTFICWQLCSAVFSCYNS